MHTTQNHACLNAREFLLYLEGAVSDTSKTRIEKHLNLCSPCFEVFLALFNDFLNGSPRPPMPAVASIGEHYCA
ncbi:MAG: zf-HC2 domain-containing protein [candidate division KSB1 bacterium]